MSKRNPKPTQRYEEYWAKIQKRPKNRTQRAAPTNEMSQPSINMSEMQEQETSSTNLHRGASHALYKMAQISENEQVLAFHGPLIYKAKFDLLVQSVSLRSNF